MNSLIKQLEDVFIFRSYLLLAVGLVLIIIGFVLPPPTANIALFYVAAFLIFMFFIFTISDREGNG